jgi:hypothetical protein
MSNLHGEDTETEIICDTDRNKYVEDTQSDEDEM